MSRQELGIEFSALHFNDGASAARMTVMLSDKSEWFYRECADPEEIAKERLYWEWVNQFFPTLILERRTVYKEKVPVGSCWKKHFAGEKKLLEYDVKQLVDYNAPLAFAVLFFLNQSYSCLNAYSIDLIDHYKIDHFEPTEESDEVTVIANNMLIRHQDSNDENLLNFTKQKEDGSLLNEQKTKFVNEYLMELLHISLMPNTGWDPIFSEKQAKLRQHLLECDVFKVVYKLSGQDLLVRLHLFCRQFTSYNSEEFFNYRNAMIKNYCIFLVRVFEEKIRRAAEQFVLKLGEPDNNRALTNMDEQNFYCEIIKSSIGKIYLNTQAQLSSEASLDHFVCISSIMTILKNGLSMCSLYSDEMFMLSSVFQMVSEMAINSKQISSMTREDSEPLVINLNRFSQAAFAKQCVEWSRRTEANGLSDVLLNKNLLIYIYDRAVAQFKGTQPTSYPHFLSAPQSVLPEGVELLYQKIVHENNADQLCLQLFEMMKVAPPDFWNLFLRQLAVVVFSEEVIVTLSGSIVLSGNQYDVRFIKSDIERLFATAKVSPQDMIQLNKNFKEALQAQIIESRDTQTYGFRASGSGHMLFSSAAAVSSQPGSTVPDQQAQAQAQSSFWSFPKISLSWPF